MTLELLNHFQAVVGSGFSKHAEFHSHNESGDICIYVDWKLMDDPDRPSKRSRKIKIRISQSAIEDYSDGRDKDRADADKRLRYFVGEKLKTFEPNHNSQPNIPVPIDEWTLTTEILNA
jgi:hypothetical protein